MQDDWQFYSPSKALDQDEGDLFEPYTWAIGDNLDLCNVCGGRGWLIDTPEFAEICPNCNGDAAVPTGSRIRREGH